MNLCQPSVSVNRGLLLWSSSRDTQHENLVPIILKMAEIFPLEGGQAIHSDTFHSWWQLHISTAFRAEEISYLYHI